MSDNPYEAAAGGGTPVTPEDLPPATTVLTNTIDDLKDNFVSYLSAGFGMFIGIFMLVVALIIGIMVPVAPGIIMENELVALGGGAVALLLYIVGLFTLSLIIVPSMQMSMYRSANQQIGDGMPMSMGSAFSKTSEDRWSFIGAYLGMTVCISIGAMFCYFPGIILSLMLPIAPVMVAIRGQSAGDALGKTFNFIQANPGWHLAVGALGLLSAIVLSFIPLVGMFLTYPFMAAYHVNTVRILMPNESY